MNTIQQHQNQVKNVLQFVGKAKFTTAKLIQMVANRNRRGLPTQLMNMGLLLSRVMPIGLTIYGLSKKGADLVGVPRFDLYNVRLGAIEHALVAQYETITSFEMFSIDDYEFEPQKHSHSYRPDVIWYTDDGKYFIEVELSPKSISDGEMDRFFNKLIGRRSIVVFTESTKLGLYLRHAKSLVENGIPDWELIDKKWFKTGRVSKYSRKEWDQVSFRQHTYSGIMSINEYIDEGFC